MRVLWLATAMTLVSAATLVSFEGLKHEIVNLGDEVDLNCDLAGYEHLVQQGRVNVSWEAMGKDVVSFDGTDFHYGPAFMPRVSASWHSKGMFSITLMPVVLSDADMYECLLEGRKALSTVIVTVVRGSDTNMHSFSIHEHEDVKLPCLGKISKSSTLDKVTVYWKRDDTVIYSLVDGKPPNPPSFMYNNAFMDPTVIQIYGDLSLHIMNVSQEDSGLYKCSYSNKNFASEENAGMAALTVLGHSTTQEVTYDDMISTSSSTSPRPSPSPTPYPTTEATPGPIEQEPLEVSTTVASQPQTFAVVIEVQDTLAPETSIDARAEPDMESHVPWVLIGVISGVLILTALILGPLVAMGKI